MCVNGIPMTPTKPRATHPHAHTHTYSDGYKDKQADIPLSLQSTEAVLKSGRFMADVGI